MRLAYAALLLLPLLPASELTDDLKARRARLMAQLSPQTLLIIQSGPERVYSWDIHYDYRQESSFFYLTALNQEGCTLVLMPGNTARKEVLFVPPGQPLLEHYNGRVVTPKQATEVTGVETVYSTDQLHPFLAALLSGEPYVTPRTYPKRPADFDAFLKAVEDGEAKLAVVLDQPPRISEPVNPALQFAHNLAARFAGVRVMDATRKVHALRQVKTPYERKVLTKSVDISVQAHLAGMRAAKAGAYEYTVRAAIEQVYRDSGAMGWGYPSITGSGSNANTLHYTKAERRMDSGDLILVDAAANYQFYTGDITRTYPVNGKFNPQQKELYRLVVDAQTEAMKVAKAGATPSDVHQKTVEVVKAGLLRLGLITDASGDQYRTWYTHGSVHGIGIDVHDVGDRFAPLAPGHAFVIEPGIYVREEALDSLPKTKENLEFIEKVKPAFEKYRGIGVRVEDSFLLTEEGLVNLSAKAPRTVEEIESFLATRR